MKKKVAIISTEVNLTGANQSLFDWLKGADRTKYEFLIVFPKFNKTIWEKCADIDCKAINGHYFHEYKRIGRENIKNFLTIILNTFWMPVVAHRVKKRLECEGVDLIHSNTFATLLGAKLSELLNVPHVWHLREFMEEDYQITHFQNSKMQKYIEAAHPIYVSEIIREKYSDRFKNGVVIYDQVLFDPNIRHDVQESLETFNILMAGTLAENKGQMDAVLATEKLIKEGYSVKLHICGDGPDKDKILDYIKSNGLEDSIFLLGFVNKLNEFRKQIDIAYVCSKMEALGRVTVENMYYMNLTIGANCGCTKELIAEGRGIPYTYGDVDSLANATKNVIACWSQMASIMNNAQAYSIEKFSKPVYPQIYEIYDEVLGE